MNFPSEINHSCNFYDWVCKNKQKKDKRESANSDTSLQIHEALLVLIVELHTYSTVDTVISQVSNAV